MDEEPIICNECEKPIIWEEDAVFADESGYYHIKGGCAYAADLYTTIPVNERECWYLLKSLAPFAQAVVSLSMIQGELFLDVVHVVREIVK